MRPWREVSGSPSLWDIPEEQSLGIQSASAGFLQEARAPLGRRGFGQLLGGLWGT